MSAITSLNCSNHFRNQVRVLANLAINAGKITPQKCKCGRSVRALAHHDDYANPFSIRWVCGICHIQRHYVLGWGYKGSGGIYHGGAYEQIDSVIFRKLSAMAKGSRSGFRKSISILALLAAQEPKPALAVFETQEAK